MRAALRAGVVFALFAALTVPTTGAAFAESALPILRGKNVIRGTESGSVVVSLPSATTIPTRIRSFHPGGPNGDIHFHGDGEFVGIVLRALDDDEPGGLIVAGRFSTAESEFGGPSLVNVLSITGLERDGGRAILPSGRYQLYLVGDGPLRATVRLHGLVGETVLRPVTPAAADAHAPEGLVGHDETGSFYSAGSTYSMPREGVSLALIWALSDNEDTIGYGDCMYRGRAPVAQVLAFGPQCNAVQSVPAAGGGAHSYGTYPAGAPGQRLLVVTRLRVGTQAGEAGERDYGAWVTSSGAIDGWGVKALFLGY